MGVTRELQPHSQLWGMETSHGAGFSQVPTQPAWWLKRGSGSWLSGQSQALVQASLSLTSASQVAEERTWLLAPGSGGEGKQQCRLFPLSPTSWEAGNGVWLLASSSGSGPKPWCKPLAPTPSQPGSREGGMAFSSWLWEAESRPPAAGSPSHSPGQQHWAGFPPPSPPYWQDLAGGVWYQARGVGSPPHAEEGAEAREQRGGINPAHSSRQHSPELQSILGCWGTES